MNIFKKIKDLLDKITVRQMIIFDLVFSMYLIGLYIAKGNVIDLVLAVAIIIMITLVTHDRQWHNRGGDSIVT